MRTGVKNERGQVAILFAMVFTFMFILFAFVVDFSHLINNKMNLQLAADTAAYTGAAWQARTLNQIGQVNYHLRQDFKELAMRVNVTHVRHNREFPRGTNENINGGDRKPTSEPFICQQAHGYKSLSGVTYQQITNLCANADPRRGGLPPIVVPPVIAAFDPFQVALNAQLNKIRDLSDQQCRDAAHDNTALVNHLIAVYKARSQFHATQIEELEKFLNEELVNDQPSENSQHPLLKSVYETVRRNLSLSNRSNDFKIEVLTPNDRKYVKLSPYSTNAKMFYYDFSTAGSGCVAIPKRTDAFQMVAGYEKTQEVMTYFAVKLTSKPRLLFMPQKWVDAAFPSLEAFAAAKPFGSRIGPKSNTDILLPVPGRPGNASTNINFSFRPNDQLGWANTKMLALFDRFHNINSAGNPDGNQVTGWPEPDRAAIRASLQLIRAPTIFDSMFYTIFPDPGGNMSEDYAERPDFALALFPDYLEAAGPDNNLIDTPSPKTAPYFRNLASTNRGGQGWIQVNATGISGDNNYGTYGLEQPGTHSTTGVSGFDIVKDKPNDFGFATKDQINSGWAPEGEPGRIGYSVKFISFDGLMRFLEVQNTDSGGLTSIQNRPTGDPNLNKLLH